MSRDMRVHEVANIFPLMSGDDFDAFTEDIRKNGLRLPIVTFQGAILDGRNRYRACIEAGIEPRFEQFNGADPLGYVLSLNLARRHLNESQRAMIHARIATLPKGVRSDTAIAVSALTQDQASRLLNISIDSGQRGRKVLNHGIPELVSKVDSGKVSVSRAADIASLSKQEQHKIVAGGPKAVDKAGSELRKIMGDAAKGRPHQPVEKINLTPDDILNSFFETAIREIDELKSRYRPDKSILPEQYNKIVRDALDLSRHALAVHLVPASRKKGGGSQIIKLLNARNARGTE